MKDLSVLRFLQIILDDNPELQTIWGRDISFMKKHLVDASIHPELSTAEFYQAARIYPHHVQVSETSITIQDGSRLVKILKRKLVYSQDIDLDKEVKELWKRRRREF